MARAVLLAAALLLLASAAARRQDDCYGAGVVLQLEGRPGRGELWYGLGAPFGGPLPLQPPQPRPLARASPSDACSPSGNGSAAYAGSIVLAERGACTFVQKARHAQAGGAALLLVYDSGPGCPAIGANLSDAAISSLSLPVAGISQAAGQHLLAAGAAGTRLLAWEPQRARLDPAAALLWLLAVGTSAAAALWAGRDYAAGCQRLTDGSAAHGRTTPEAHAGAVEVQMVSSAGAVAFVAVASAMLILLFFFLSHVFALVLTALFSLASLQALTALLAAAAARCSPRFAARSCSLGPWLGPVSAPTLLAAPLAAAWVGGWLAAEPDGAGWVLQDGMGVALMLLILRQFLLPDLKVACLLLPLCFCYDVFWVFLQPLLTSGPSVMVEVATGGASHESMPMLLRVPTLWGPPYGASMLGFGDVVLPGLLLVFARIWDLTAQRPGLAASYFWPLLAGYGGGLLLTYAALLLRLFGDQGQPALLYLVPCTLGTCLALAWRRGELRLMWGGVAAAAPLLKRANSSAAASGHTPAAAAAAEAAAAADLEAGEQAALLAPEQPSQPRL